MLLHKFKRKKISGDNLENEISEIQDSTEIEVLASVGNRPLACVLVLIRKVNFGFFEKFSRLESSVATRNFINGNRVIAEVVVDDKEPFVVLIHV